MRFAADTVTIVGAGVLARAVAAKLAPRFSVRLLSRRPGEDVEPLFALEKGGEGPVVVMMAADERAEIARARRLFAGEVPRAVVATANILALTEALPFHALEGRAVLVVTNPVELIAELVAGLAPGAHVLAFGMGTDRSRIVEVLARDFGIPDPGRALPIGGVHAVRAIPALSAVPGLLDRVGHDALHAAVRALTASEFRGDRPPFERPLDQLAGLLERLLSGSRAPEDVSGYVEEYGAFLGGTYDPATGAFTPAPLGAPELPILEAALEELHAVGAPR